MSTYSKKNHSPRSPACEKMHKSSLVASFQEANPQMTLKHVVPLKSLRLSPNHSGKILSFVIKLAALETVRRFSKAKCPILWRFVQAFQVLGYPPLKWLQRWGPLSLIVRGTQSISRPLLLLSIATAFSNDSENCRVTGDRVDESQSLPESLCRSPTSDSLKSEESIKDIVPDNWLRQLFAELEKQGISLPERFKEDELHRFYTAANGDLACLVSSLKKTIRWRESYNILSSQELEVWSHLVFWHGFDVMMRPCLVIRLGLACSTLAPHDRPRFAQAVVSQIDLGVLNLTDEKDSQITVLMDCDGLSPFRFPMNMMRSCAILVQDHYPNRLGTLFILRLPPVVRVLTQTFIQILRPATREKLRILGKKNHKFLSEFLRTVPAFLGSDCECSRCRMLSANNTSGLIQEISEGESSGNVDNDFFDTNDLPSTELPFISGCDHVLRSAILAILLMWVVIAFFSAMHNTDSLSSFL
ncbi:hypothetical protein M5K25_017965 [Dendrobium thyrsiflorum]|uniref:CRAL-TRIO domain-containing protein n=1 Tax=Dendrobium thyrsiflorum TaxID=117978 RepID=A0ABD0UHF6_DENTH